MSENGGSFDPWAVLGIPCDASRDTAHAAYRRLAMRYHPDRNPEDREAQARFLAVRKAWDVIEKRRASAPAPASPFASAFEDLVRASEDFEAALMPGRPARGADVEAEVLISFQDSLSDCSQMVAGSGGGGRIRRTTIVIPGGVVDREVIVYRGLGEPGVAGGPRGDLRLLVCVQAPDGFRVRGLDVLRTVRVPVWDAALGCEIPVPMPRGGVRRLTLPPGSPPSVERRFAGAGVETAGRRGDYLVEVAVEVPDAAADPKLGKLFAAMRPGSLVAA
ncbi:DnaJ C-terminal domain-containing protein [Methylorubrum extorquens]|uniref:Heat shock protein DnaJ domain protein n=1 Tax=Methylorubrum extorquens DSM 13060 TaxID=882800 RepID=H1KHA3_METEX|nr:DnaJ C-terminal domain-containing protein [Methylorubrum extorquens]EHP93129.1 heat shock protein DnaJ domain protein [Methylorubrum extorquens DSM 13060]